MSIINGEGGLFHAAEDEDNFVHALNEEQYVVAELDDGIGHVDNLYLEEIIEDPEEDPEAGVITRDLDTIEDLYALLREVSPELQDEVVMEFMVEAVSRGLVELEEIEGPQNNVYRLG